MKKTITGLVLGLIGGIISLFWGFVCGVLGYAASIIGSSAGGSGFNWLYLLGWLSFEGAIFAIVGASNCVKHAGRGATCLLIATVLCGSLQIYLFCNAIAGSTPIVTLVIVLLLPTILLAVATLFAYFAKEVECTAKADNSTAAPHQNKMDSLEVELTKLKDMLDKGLISQEEYATAKKNVIEKHI